MIDGEPVDGGRPGGRAGDGGRLRSDEDGVLVAGTDEPTESHLWLVGWPTVAATAHRARRATTSGCVAGGTLVVATAAPATTPATVVTVRRGGGRPVTVPSYAETPPLRAARCS